MPLEMIDPIAPNNDAGASDLFRAANSLPVIVPVRSILS